MGQDPGTTVARSGGPKKKPLILTCVTLLLAATPGTALAASAEGAYGTQHSSRAALSSAFSIRPGEPAVGGVGRVSPDGWSWRGADPDEVTGQRVSPDAEFHVGSISKTFLATVMLQLAAEHRVDLDGTVQQYLPGVLPDTFQPITIRELLNHTSGLPDVDAGAPPMTVDQQIAGRLQYRTFDQIIQQTLRPADRPWPGPVFAPGTAQRYSSFAYRVAGRIIEEVTGHLRRYRAFPQPPGRRPLYPQDTECSCRGCSFDDVRHARDVLGEDCGSCLPGPCRLGTPSARLGGAWHTN
ncbi:serine hydrolase domain-containing protein [Streptomyces sp. NPDC004008]